MPAARINHPKSTAVVTDLLDLTWPEARRFIYEALLELTDGDFCHTSPSPPFGMMPCVEQTAEGSLVVHGLADWLPRPLLPSDLDQLVRERHALSVDATVAHTITPATVAGWIGSEFLREAGAVPRGIPWELRHAAGDRGHFWLGDREAILYAMEDWMKEAARGVFVRGDEHLAKLLGWVSTDGLMTRAAVLSTSSTDEERQERIAGWTQAERDAGRPTTEAELTERLRRIRDEVLGTNLSMRSIRLAGYPSALVPRRRDGCCGGRPDGVEALADAGADGRVRRPGEAPCACTVGSARSAPHSRSQK